MLNKNKKDEDVIVDIINENVYDFEPNYEKLKEKMEEEKKKSTNVTDVNTDEKNN